MRPAFDNCHVRSGAAARLLAVAVLATTSGCLDWDRLRVMESVDAAAPDGGPAPGSEAVASWVFAPDRFSGAFADLSPAEPDVPLMVPVGAPVFADGGLVLDEQRLAARASTLTALVDRLVAADGFSVELWLGPYDADGSAELLELNMGLRMSLGDVGITVFLSRETEEQFDVSGALDQDGPHHVVFSFRRDTGLGLLFIDGAIVATDSLGPGGVEAGAMTDEAGMFGGESLRVTLRAAAFFDTPLNESAVARRFSAGVP